MKDGGGESQCRRKMALDKSLNEVATGGNVCTVSS